jgi:hypothetical protein
MSAHTEGYEENLPAGTLIQSMRLSSPLGGAQKVSDPLLCLLWAALTQLAGFV